MFTRIWSGANHPRHALTALVSRFARLQPRISDINQNLELEFTASSPSGSGTVPPFRSVFPFRQICYPLSCHLLTVRSASYLGVIRSRKNVAGWRCEQQYQQFTRLRPGPFSRLLYLPRNFPLEEPVTRYIWLSSRPALSFGHLPREAREVG